MSEGNFDLNIAEVVLQAGVVIAAALIYTKGGNTHEASVTSARRLLYESLKQNREAQK